MGSFTIGALARAAGVSVETVRYYERRGLLAQPERGAGYRQYSLDDVHRIELIRRAKGLGFTLHEIRDLIGADAARSPAAVLAAARAKLAAVDVEAERLGLLRQRLTKLVDACQAGSGGCLALEVSAG